MKTNSLLFSLVILSLSLTVLSARAASPTEETAPIQLPVYVITAERQSAGEKSIDRSLQQLRAIAAKPITVKGTAPLLKAKTAGDQTESKTPTVVVAGL